MIHDVPDVVIFMATLRSCDSFILAFRHLLPRCAERSLSFPRSSQAADAAVLRVYGTVYGSVTTGNANATSRINIYSTAVVGNGSVAIKFDGTIMRPSTLYVEGQLLGTIITPANAAASM